MKMESSIQGYVVFSPHNAWLDYTVCSTPDGSIAKLLKERNTVWADMEANGYKVIEFYAHESNFRKYQVVTSHQTDVQNG